MCIIFIRIFYYDNKRIKELERTIKVLLENSGRDFDKDIKYLNSIIKEEIDYTEKILIPMMESKKDGKMYNSNDYEKLLSLNLKSTIDILSDSYKNMLSYYFNDLDNYILFKLKLEYEPLIIALNNRKIK